MCHDSDQNSPSTLSIYPLLEKIYQEFLEKELRNKSGFLLQNNSQEACEHASYKLINYIRKKSCYRAKYFTTTQSKNKLFSQQTNGNHNKQRNNYSMNNDPQISTKLEDHIASLDDYNDESFVNTEQNECDNKIYVHRTMLRILNLSEESGGYKTLEKEDDMIQE